MDWVVRLPSLVYRLSCKKAGGDRQLQAHIREYLVGYSGYIDPALPPTAVPDAVYCPDCARVHAPGACPTIT